MADDHEDLTYFRPSDGAGLSLNDGVHYRMRHHDGFGIGDFEHFSTAIPGLHGERVTATRLGPKVITIDLHLIGAGIVEIENRRKELIQYLSPLLIDVDAGKVGKLRLAQMNGDVRQMDCVLSEAVPMPTSQHIGKRGALFQVRFKSVNSPTVYDPDIKSQVFTKAAVAGFTFPFTFPILLGSSGIFNNGNINYAGSADTPLLIDIEGPCLSPILTNYTTGRTLSFNNYLYPASLAAGDHLVINTDPEQWSVLLNGVSVLEKLSTSDFWGLIPGNNNIILDMANATGATKVTFSWYDRFIGG